MKNYFGQEIPILDGTAYDKVCIAVRRGEIGAYISDDKYQSIYPGDKNTPMFTHYREMWIGLLRYLEEHPEQEAPFAQAFIKEITESPNLVGLITLIEMLRDHTYSFKGKSFFTDELVQEMANQCEKKADRLAAVREAGLGHPYRKEKLQFIDRFVFQAYGIHLVKE